MSRIGKLPIKLQDKTKASLAAGVVNFEGPKGKLQVRIPNASIKVEVKGQEIMRGRTLTPTNLHVERVKRGWALG